MAKMGLTLNESGLKFANAKNQERPQTMHAALVAPRFRSPSVARRSVEAGRYGIATAIVFAGNDYALIVPDGAAHGLNAGATPVGVIAIGLEACVLR